MKFIKGNVDPLEISSFEFNAK